MIRRSMINCMGLKSARFQFSSFGTIAFPKPAAKTIAYDNGKASAAAPVTGQVKVSVKASQVTIEDIRSIKGISFANQLTSVVGTTSVGLVDAVGPNVSAIKSGDNVFISYPGTWTDSLTIPIENVCKIPSLAAEEAALIPSVASAWAILTQFTPLKSGDIVISLGSSNPIGLAIAEVGKALELVVINANPSEVNSKEFKAKLKGEVRLCATSIAGSAASDVIKSLAPKAVQVFYNGAIIPVTSGEGLSISVSAAIFEGKSLSGFDFSSWASINPEGFRQGVEYAAALIANKKIKLNAKTFKMSDYAAALKLVEDSGALVVLKD